MNTNPRYCTYSRNRTGINDFISFVRLLQTKLSDPMFAAVYPSPAQVLPLLDEIADIQKECDKRNFFLVRIRNIKRDELEVMLKQQCMSVNGIACGDTDVLFASGFKLNKEPQRRPEPSTGRIEKIEAGTSYGELIVSTTGIKDSDYCLGKIIDSQKMVYHATGKPSKIVFQNIPVGEIIRVLVAGVNGNGQGDWTAPVDHFISPLKANHPSMRPKAG